MQKNAEKERQRAYFRCIEAELYNFTILKKEFKELNLAIIESERRPEVSTLTGPGDPTGQKAIKLTTSIGLYEMERRIKAIEKAMKETETLDPLRMELVKMKYEDKKSHDAIMDELNISEATFYRWRREFVYLIADKLGWDAGQGL